MPMSFGSFASRVVATAVVATDGTGDFTTIQAAIDSLPSGGGVVYVKEGTYTITAAITFPNHNISLIGSGASTIIATTSDIVMVLVASKNKIFLSQFQIYGGGALLTNNAGLYLYNVNNCLIDGIWINNCGSHGLQIDTAAASCIISNSFSFSNFGSGITLANITQSIIRNCYVTGNTKHGIFCNYADDSIITGCQVSGNDSGNSATYDGISLANSDDNIISVNRCKDNDRYEINISGATCDRNVVLGNNCIGADHVGAINDAGTDTELAHNQEA